MELCVVKFHDTSPSAEFVSRGDKVVFFYIQSEGEITSLDNPSDEELLAGVERELDAVKTFYDMYKKPVIIQTSYHPIEGCWKGFEFAQVGASGCVESNPENACTHNFSGLDQTRVINAYFEAIKDRP